MSKKYDIIFIGSGPGGYVGAIRAAQLGQKVCVIEKDKTFGGTCLNIGCIPSKALLDSSEHYDQAQHEFEEHGIEVSEVKLNLAQMMKRKDKVVSELTGGISYLFDKNKIDSVQGTGSLKSQNEVEVKKEDGGTEVLEATHIVLASGSVPVELPFLQFDGKNIISSTEAIALQKVPPKMVVVGGGAIGLELGSVWNRLGSEVTVIEYSPVLSPAMDRSIMKKLQALLKKQGMKFEMGAKVTGADIKSDNDLTVNFEAKDGNPKSLDCNMVLVAVGRRAYPESLNLEAANIKLDERGRVATNEHLQTNVPNIFAIGDLIEGPMLAHKAEEEGVAVAEYIVNGYGHVNYDTCPGVIYTWPEVASVGLTEEQVKEKGIAYNVGSFPFSANGRAKAMNSTDGNVKIIADKNTDRVLGVHIVGPRASDMIAEAVMAMEFQASSEDIARCFHAHPTLPEALREAALAVTKSQRQL